MAKEVGSLGQTKKGYHPFILCVWIGGGGCQFPVTSPPYAQEDIGESDYVPDLSKLQHLSFFAFALKNFRNFGVTV